MRGTRRLTLIGLLVALVASGPGARASSAAAPLGAEPAAQRGATALRADAPGWFSDALAARVADDLVVPAPPEAPLPGVVGIRPGSWMIAPYSCTMSFVFRSASGLGIATAGHCADHLGQSIVLLTVDPTAAANPVLVDIGTVVVRRANGVGDDFALVAIRPELQGWVSATAAVVGGPCGRIEGSVLEPVWHYGHGYAVGSGGTPRAGLATVWDATSFAWAGAAVYGDSGSPVRITSSLRGAGTLTHLVVREPWLPAVLAGTRLGRMLALAPGWYLVNSPLCL